MEPVKVHAKYTGHDGAHGYEQAKSYDLWIKLVSWAMIALTGQMIEVCRRSIVFQEGEGLYEKRGLTEYKTLADFFTEWTEIRYER